MKTVQLTPNIRYVTLCDAEGEGALIYYHTGDVMRRLWEVYDRDDLVETIREIQEMGL